MPRKDKEKRKEYTREWNKNNLDKLRIYRKKQESKDTFEYKRKMLFWRTRHRAKEIGLDFNLSLEDIVIPIVCPILSIPLKFGLEDGKDSCPSIDRIDNNKGYTKENICIISNRANRMKSDLTIDLAYRLIDYMKGELK